MADQRREPDQRPSPDALLAMANKQESRKGRLKIFLGAAPGVGKTYEMLQEARARLKDSVDVVVGAVETHGRKETEALLEGLEVVPRRRIEYKGQWLEEMDYHAQEAWLSRLKIKRQWLFTVIPVILIFFMLLYSWYLASLKTKDKESQYHELWRSFIQKMKKRGIKLSIYSVKDSSRLIESLNDTKIWGIWNDLLALSFQNKNVTKDVKKRIKRL